MGAPPPNSQAAPLPTNLPFRLVSKTIGSGAYASIRKAAPLHAPSPVIAVKFINKEHAYRTGRLRPKQIELEISLHHRVSGHENIIKFVKHGEDTQWIWLAMELAEGGDLFDKIEADEGVNEDVAHFYFSQLVAAMSWCHGRGVAHRDIKPENMLLSGKGDLKLADFGLATQYMEPKTGQRKLCGMVCGSPPYIAPEILAVGQANMKRKASNLEKAGYDPQIADVWSCAIVLFVLFAGNTPWDQPVAEEDYEYYQFVKTSGKPVDELWEKLPQDALSLIRGMLRSDVAERMTLEHVDKHPWFRRSNPLLNEKGRVKDSVALAMQMFEKLHINLDDKPKKPTRSLDAMDIDQPRANPGWAQFASTQPDTPTTDLTFDWEETPRLGLNSASQPTNHDRIDIGFLDRLNDEPSMSQFAPTASMPPLSLTQNAREFRDILPSYSMARFVSALPLSQLVSTLTSALHRLSIPVSPMQGLAYHAVDRKVAIRVKAMDRRKQPLHGNVVIERLSDSVHEVRFVKAKGDPLQWRYLFKQIAVLCKDSIIKPDS